MAPGDHHHRCSSWLRALAVLLLAAPVMSARPAVEAPPAGQPLVRAAAARFSELAEVTPANVRGLLPLVAPSRAVMPQDPRLDASAAVDLPLQRFVDERTGHIEPMRKARVCLDAHGHNCVMSYLIGSGGAAESGPAAPTLARRELRAWDPIERHVVWSVREALPISSGTLVTAGGLVFYGTSDGWLKALDARTGRVLWQHRVAGAGLDEPMSYRGADGHQYIAVRATPRNPRAGSETPLLFTLAH